MAGGILERLSPLLPWRRQDTEEEPQSEPSTYEEALAALEPATKRRVLAVFARTESGQLRAPLLPGVALELLDLTGRQNVSFEKLSRLAVSDPGVASRIIRLASSPVFSTTPPKGVKEALVWIGLEGVRHVAFEISFASNVLRRGPYLHLAERTIRHARTMSALCRLLARPVEVHPGLAALAGLVHALGPVALLDELSAVRRDRPISAPLVTEAIRRLHPQASAQMARSFRLDDEVVRALAEHQGDMAGAAPLTRLLRFADLVSPGDIGSCTVSVAQALEESGLPVAEEAVLERVRPLQISIEELASDPSEAGSAP